MAACPGPESGAIPQICRPHYLDLRWGYQIRRAVGSYYHPASTCRMGPDAAAVVDLELRVRGVTGLRVADASVLPVIPNAHPNATVLAVAERAAELIGGRPGAAKG